MSESEKGGSCCKKLAMSVMVVAVLVGGFTLLWQYVLTEESKSTIGGKFNNTIGTISDGNGLPGLPAENSDESQSSGYQFNQCSTNNNTECCNGLDSICDLRADEVLYAGVHNAMATSDDGFLLAPNHLLSLEKALDAGYRALNVDFADCEDGFKLVHGKCAFGSRNPSEVFTSIVDFLQKNPSEVVLLSLQIDNEASVQDVVLTDIETLTNGVTGMTELLYQHPDPSTPWPTLRELIDNDTRLLFFHYNGQSCQEVTCPNGFHDWFEYAAETEFEFSSVEEVRATDTSCAITRGSSGSDSNFLAINSFVTLPSKAASVELNTYDSLHEYMQSCSDLNGGADVNVIWVDFWSEGDLLRLTQTENQARAEAKAKANGDTTADANAEDANAADSNAEMNAEEKKDADENAGTRRKVRKQRKLGQKP